MSIHVSKEIKGDLEVFICYKNKLPKSFAYLKDLFSADKNELFVHASQTKKVIFVGAGEEEKITLEDVRNLMGLVARKVGGLKVQIATIHLLPNKAFKEDDLISAITQGIGLGLYVFEKYKTKERDIKPVFYLTGIEDYEKAKITINKANNQVEGISLARDLINEPSNILTPESLANITQRIGKDVGLEVEILEANQLEDLGMNALLTVGQGSIYPPRLIIMRYMKGGDNPIIGLVGKGLTCDTGGYSLKTTNSMHYMKSDMSGAANVLGLMQILAKNKIPQNVIGVIPVCENVISGCSYKIGDVIKTMSGITVEILNTDAEGRLALADALYYITEKEKVDSVIDMATLTGVAGTTFDNIYTATVSNNDEFYSKFHAASKYSQEKFWKLPNDPDYEEMIKSDVADIKNTSGADTITAALFLQKFIQKKPWIHLDIAATACTNPGRTNYEYKGGTGVGIRTLYELIKVI